MDPATVTITQLRWPDTVEQRSVLQRLGEDMHGVWLAADDRSHVRLIPASSWWTATWETTNDGQSTVTVQTARPATWTSPDTVEMILLDLEIVSSDGEVSVVNEALFADRRRERHYPEPVVDRARTTTAAMYLAVSAHHEPFGDTGPSWLRVAEEDRRR